MTSLPLFPLNTVLFPDGRLPLQIFEVRYLDMINKCIADGSMFGVVALTQGSEVRKPGVEESFADVGTLAKIEDWKAPMPGLLNIACSGTTRFRLLSSQRLRNGLWMGDIETLAADQIITLPDELQNTAAALTKLIDSLEAEGVSATEMPFSPPYRLHECGWVANRWSELLPLPAMEKQRLLMLDNPVLRLELIQDMLDAQGLLD